MSIQSVNWENSCITAPEEKIRERRRGLMAFNLTYKYSSEWPVTNRPLSASTHRNMDCILASRKEYLDNQKFLLGECKIDV